MGLRSDFYIRAWFCGGVGVGEGVGLQNVLDIAPQPCCSYSVALWGHCCVLASLKKEQSFALGTVILSGMSSTQCARQDNLWLQIPLMPQCADKFPSCFVCLFFDVCLSVMITDS